VSSSNKSRRLPSSAGSQWMLTDGFPQLGAVSKV